MEGGQKDVLHKKNQQKNISMLKIAQLWDPLTSTFIFHTNSLTNKGETPLCKN